VETGEVLEHVEAAEKAAEGQKDFGRRAAALISALTALLPRAQEYERERDTVESRHRGFQIDEAAFRLGIVRGSISIVARASWLLRAGAALDGLGLLRGSNAFLLLISPP